MAVPISTRKIVNRLTGHNKRGLSLTYAGKKSAEDVLAFSPGCFDVDPFFAQDANNKLFHAENLHVLSALANDKTIRGNVRLVYIDPPFATAASFESRKQKHAYDDILVGEEFIENLRERLLLLHHILSEDGSIYLHLDERMIFYAKIILDEIFGVSNYRNCIVRKKCNPKNYTKKTYGNISDYLLFYTKSDCYVWNRPLEPWDEERAYREYPCVDGDGRRFKKVPIHAPGVRNGETGKPWRGVMPPPGKHWQYPPETLEDMDRRGEIYWSANRNPRRKIYLENSEGVPLQNIWLDVKDAHNQNIKITGYPTEKNFDLLCRIVGASSNPGDIVLDCYAGSGTTLAAATKLKRNWIGVDNSNEAIKTIINRLMYGVRPMGDFVKNVKQNSLSWPLLDPSQFTLFQERTISHSSASSELEFVHK